MKWYHHIFAIFLIGLLCAAIGYCTVAFASKYRCVPGQNDPCHDVYGNRGSYNCKSNGYWPDYCRVNGELREM